MILVCFIYVFTLVFLHKLYRSFVAPPVFFLLYWTIQLFIPMIFAGSFYYSGSAFLFIYLCVLSFAVGFVLTSGYTGTTAEGMSKLLRRRITGNRIPLLRVQLILLVFNAVLAVYELKQYGYSITKIQSLAAIETISRDISLARLDGTVSEGGLASILKVPFYTSFLLSGILVRTVKGKFLYKYLNFFIGLFLMLITTKKTYLLYPLVLFFSTWLLLPPETAPGEKRSFKFSRVAKISLLCITLIGLFLYAQANRYGMKLGSDSIVFERMKVYFFGHASVFSIWYDHQAAFDHYEFGKYNFSSIISVITQDDLKEGIFTDFTNLDAESLRSNIYTAYRGWLEDFGYYSLIVHFFFGFLVGIIYKEYRLRQSNLSFVLLAAFYTYVLWSFVINPFNYTTILLAYILLAVNLQLWNKKPVSS